MGRSEDKLNAVEFTIDTWMDPRRIREAGWRAMEAGRRFMNNTINEASVVQDGITYVIRGPGNILDQMTFVVMWSELEDGNRRLQLSVSKFLTVQSTFAMIPVTPKSVVALESIRRFGESLLCELLANGAGAPAAREAGPQRNRTRQRTNDSVERPRRSLLLLQHD